MAENRPGTSNLMLPHKESQKRKVPKPWSSYLDFDNCHVNPGLFRYDKSELDALPDAKIVVSQVEIDFQYPGIHQEQQQVHINKIQQPDKPELKKILKDQSKREFKEWLQTYKEPKQSEIDSDDEFEPTRKKTRAILLSGPGKLQLVEAKATELNFDILRVGCNQVRNGTVLTSLLKETISNYNIRRTSDMQPATKKSKISDFFGQAKKPKFAMKDTLVCVEDVDVLYASDQGFWRTLLCLIEEALCPIVLTCNDLFVLPMNVQEMLVSEDGSCLKLLKLKPFTKEDYCVYMAKKLYEFKVQVQDLMLFGQCMNWDVRRSLTLAKFWSCSDWIQLELVTPSTSQLGVGQSSELAVMYGRLSMVKEPLIIADYKGEDKSMYPDLYQPNVVVEEPDNDVMQQAHQDLQLLILQSIANLEDGQPKVQQDAEVGCLIEEVQTDQVYFADYRPYILKILKLHHDKSNYEVQATKKPTRSRANKDDAYFDCYYYDVEGEKKLIE